MMAAILRQESTLDGNTNQAIHWSTEQVAAAKRCNGILYDAVQGSPEAGAESIRWWLRNGDMLPIKILRPGTAVRP
jgi:hypothetical protein